MAGKADGGQSEVGNHKYPATISLAVDEELRTRLQELQVAARQPSLSSFLRMVLQDYVESCR
jgi:hypothetical protein